ncbi:hypothetical protein FOZ60_013911 [Perkinsus olseni]|uniref:Uncharacterized protein n=1 Tax=Perkinsus olseni TaxID=32597 RepID=A0A7J6PA01_PEROL|nr:hypothetical protein FOZ60_013911 [Perkinsus olseni]
MKRNRAEIEVDGHLVNLLIDTGSHITYLVYGGWYESLYGRGSCKYLISGCYFCSPTDPCDPDSLLAQRVEKLEYVDGDVVSYVNRNVTINFGERKISKFQIGLMVGCSRVDKDIQPYALLGLSFSLPREPHAQVKTPSFIKQLVDAGEIPQPTVSIHVFKFSVGMNGRLVLGQPLERTEGTTVVPENAEGELSVAFDSGDDVTTLPRPVFSMVWEAIEAEFGPDRVDGSKMLRFNSKNDQRLTAFIDANGRIWSRKRVVRYLPVIVIKVDDTFSFELPLTSHVRVCEGSWCRLMVIDAGELLGFLGVASEDQNTAELCGCFFNSVLLSICSCCMLDDVGVSLHVVLDEHSIKQNLRQNLRQLLTFSSRQAESRSGYTI